MGLQDYKEIVGLAAGVTTVAQFFSPLFICRDIIKQKGTRNIDPTPFVGGIGISILNLQYGIILQDPAMIPVNIFGLVLNLIYVAVYYFYTDDRFQVIRNLGKTVACVTVLIGYAQLENQNRIEINFGIIVTLLMLMLIASPLFNLKEILNTKDTSALPFPMILSGTVVTFLWLLYGVIIENIFIQVQNIIGFALCAVQLGLCIMYPGKPIKKED